MAQTPALVIEVRFPLGIYQGAALGRVELLPSPARLFEAFVAAAAAGPHAVRAPIDARSEEARRLKVPKGTTVLSPRDEDIVALRWLEEHEPLGLSLPGAEPRPCQPERVDRYRVKAGISNELDDFEPRVAVPGVIEYAWPSAPPNVEQRLALLASEITHVGRADSIAIVTVRSGTFDPASPNALALHTTRGRGTIVRIPQRGRLDNLLLNHIRLTCVAGKHGKESKARPADRVTSPLLVGTGERRLAPVRGAARWPYDEVLALPLKLRRQHWVLRREYRVPFAAAIHKAIVRTIGSAVPEFVRGKEGENPLRGPGHLAIQPLRRRDQALVAFAIPTHVSDADRAVLLEALEDGLVVAFARRKIVLDPPIRESALPFWSTRNGLMQSAVPVVLDAPGYPRKFPWTLEDATLCSIGYAMRGVLERRDTEPSSGVPQLEWGTGWEFRRALVDHLREHCGVRARVKRVLKSPAPYFYKAREGELIVAVDCVVDLGALAPEPGGFLALGKARHVGGGLLEPNGSAT